MNTGKKKGISTNAHFSSVINKAKTSFENAFADDEFYNRQTRDEEHLNNILEKLKLKAGDRILDLGTGTAYLAFGIARKYHDVSIIGLDIVAKTLEENNQKAREQDILNVEFMCYGGLALPFEDDFFDWVVTRYVVHHFPDIHQSFTEVTRVLKPGGFFFISDPVPNENDDFRFVDAFMQLKDDGHIKFYTLEEFIETALFCGMRFMDSFDSSITFPRIANEAYDELIAKTDDVIRKSYNVKRVGNEYYITEKVINALFQKEAGKTWA